MSRASCCCRVVSQSLKSVRKGIGTDRDRTFGSPGWTHRHRSDLRRLAGQRAVWTHRSHLCLCFLGRPRGKIDRTSMITLGSSLSSTPLSRRPVVRRARSVFHEQDGYAASVSVQKAAQSTHPELGPPVAFSYEETYLSGGRKQFDVIGEV